jgi:hypothetical protein
VDRSTPIRLLAPEAREPGWCWRDDWLSGGESIYSILAMFESLNVIGGRHVTDALLKVERDPYGKRIAGPTIDLRTSSRFDLERLTRAAHLSPQALREAFVTDAFSISGWSGSMTLRWCPQCARRAFHCTIFQLPFINTCPAHGDMLHDRCARCRSLFPYKLVGTYTSKLFHCPRCKHSLWPGLYEAIKKNRLTSEERTSIRSKFDLLAFCDRLPTVLVDLLGARPASTQNDIVVSSSRDFSVDLEFVSFVSQVLVSLENSPQLDWLCVVPSVTFNEAIPDRSRGLRTKTKMKEGVAWPEHLIPRADVKLRRAAQIYRIVRRHIWRSALRGHRPCLFSACRHLWWPLSGDKTSKLCPVAVAYIRWRMGWEHLTVASQLMDRPSKTPLGLAAWLATVAPFGASSYTPTMTAWLVDHILAQDLLSSFRSLLNAARRQVTLGVVDWSRDSFVDQRQTCWVCAGKGTAQSPFRLFTAPPPSLQLANSNDLLLGPAGRAHLKTHLQALRLISH